MADILPSLMLSSLILYAPHGFLQKIEYEEPFLLIKISTISSLTIKMISF
jgi:hypothetical protein